MGIMDSIAQNTGNIEKAVIEVIDIGNREAKEEDCVKVLGSGGMVPDTSFVNTDMLSDVLTNTLKMGGITDEYVETVGKKGRKYYQVQFNPSTLQLSGHAGGLISKIDYSAGEKGNPPPPEHEPGEHPPEDMKPKRSATYERGNTYISLTVSLLFDCCDPQDAFLDDKIALNPTSIGTGVAKGVMGAMGKKKTSIQKDVEGFIGALRNKYTRLVTFHWGDFSYSGMLQSIGANYTMFNVNGEPLRATVDISIVCADDETWPNSLAVWQKKYKSSFENGSESFVKNSKKVGNLLNF